jgi:hypothetical protein
VTGSYTDAKLSGNLLHAQAGGAKLAGGGLDLGPHPRAAEALAVRFGAAEARFHPLLDHGHGALELREDATHPEHGLAGRGGGVDPLLMQVEINPLRVDVAEEGDQVLEAAAQTIDRSRGDQVALVAHDGLAQLIEGRTLIAVLGPAHALVDELADDVPAGAGGYRAELGQLVVGGLSVRTNPGIEGDSFLVHGHLRR